MGGVEETGDPYAPWGSRPWCLAMLRTVVRDKHDTATKASDLRRHMILLRDNEHWRELSDAKGVPFPSWEDFCRSSEPFGLGLATRQVEAVLTETDDKVTVAAVLARHGGDRKSEKAKKHQPDKRKVDPEYGNSRDYALARLRRDRPDLAARAEAGELSPHAAAIEAGFRKRRDTYAALWSAWRQASEEERGRFKAALADEAEVTARGEELS
jgi:hypothetical protein